MNATETPVTAFRSVGSVAYRLNVSTPWLKAEAEAGRVPALRAGKRLLMDLDTVRAALVARSVAACCDQGEAVSC